MTKREDKGMETIYKLTNTLMRACDMQQALDSVCRIVVESGLAKFAWIGFAEEDKSIKPVAKAGAEQGYLSAVKITYDNSKLGMGPTGRSLKSGRPRIIRFIDTDPSYAPWRAEALKRGFKSSIAIPMFAKRKALGILNVYRGEIDAFSKDDVRLFEEFSRSLSLSVMNFKEIESRKKTERELVSSEEKFRALFEEAPVGVILGVNKKIQYANKATLRIFGYDDESELQGKDYQIMIAPQSIEYAEGLSKQLWKGKKLLGEYEVIGQKKNGSQIVLSMRVEMLKLREGNMIISFFNDITKRKRAEAALIASESRFRQLIETSPAAMFAYRDGKVIYSNPTTSKITGYSQEETKGMDFWQFVHPDFKQMVKERGIARMQGERVPINYDLKIIRKDGKERWINITVTPVRIDSSPEPTFMVTGHDITDHKRIDEALQESERKYKMLINNSSDIAFELSVDGKLTAVNPTAMHKMKWYPKEWIGKDFKPLLHPKDLPMVMENYKKVLKGEYIPPYKVRMKKKTGGYIIGEVVASPLRDDGHIKGVVGIIKNILDYKE
jgi:PAS domain S-box-containing protein